MRTMTSPKSDAGPETLTQMLRARVADAPEVPALTFFGEGEAGDLTLTYRELDRRVRTAAAALQAVAPVGERALLLYPPGLEFVVAFFACQYAGLIAVPAYPPDLARLDRSLPRLLGMVDDAAASLVLTTQEIVGAGEQIQELAPGLAALSWVSTDRDDAASAEDWRDPRSEESQVAYLQYTSGSTGTPKGVVLSHSNLLHNIRSIDRAFEVDHGVDRLASWLPMYHDMGLIGMVLAPVFANLHCALMSPISFLRQPHRWLQMISRSRATISGAPNFAYDLCVRRTTPEQREGLDLSSWDLAYNGAEPVRPETLDRFAAAFAPYGFRREAFYPCYGLAENTLLVSGALRREAPARRTLKRSLLERGRAVSSIASDDDSQTLVACGRIVGDQELRIVDPETREPCDDGAVGEIWVSGGSVASGYWRRPEYSCGVFEARTSPPDDRVYLRTGDLGFVDGDQLYVSGRLKDVIILHGRNIAPHDVECAVETSHPDLRTGCGAAFSVVEKGEEKLVVVQELRAECGELDEILLAIRSSVAERMGLSIHALVLLEPRSIHKTSSGKIKRHACRDAFLSNGLNVVNADIARVR